MLSSSLKIEKWFWEECVTSLYNPFPRDTGKFRYPKSHNMKEYLFYVLSSVLKKEDAYVAFYSDEEIEKGEVNRIFLDIDSDNVKEVWENIKPFVTIFWKNMHVFFSGKKGFHLSLYIEPVSFKELQSNRKRLYDVLSTWCQTYLDAQTFLDIRRIYRITFTYHSKGGRWKIPVHCTWNIDKILSLAENPEPDIFKPLMRKVEAVNYKIFLREPYEVIEEKLFSLKV